MNARIKAKRQALADARKRYAASRLGPKHVTDEESDAYALLQKLGRVIKKEDDDADDEEE